MAIRIAFEVKKDLKENNFYVYKNPVNFLWHKGLSISQKQKSIDELHKEIKNIDSGMKILEISTKSQDPIGKKLSAFNLSFCPPNFTHSLSVENAFQGSKVFTNGGPYTDIYFKTSIEAKKDERIKKSGNLIYFLFNNQKWDLTPKTLFYDWLYLNALNENPNLAQYLINFNCFTDIEFNHEKSINCQAFTCALFVALYKSHETKKISLDKEEYTSFIMKYYKYNQEKYIQNTLI